MKPYNNDFMSWVAGESAVGVNAVVSSDIGLMAYLMLWMATTEYKNDKKVMVSSSQVHLNSIMEIMSQQCYIHGVDIHNRPIHDLLINNQAGSNIYRNGKFQFKPLETDIVFFDNASRVPPGFLYEMASKFGAPVWAFFPARTNETDYADIIGEQFEANGVKLNSLAVATNVVRADATAAFEIEVLKRYLDDGVRIDAPVFISSKMKPNWAFDIGNEDTFKV